LGSPDLDLVRRCAGDRRAMSDRRKRFITAPSGGEQDRWRHGDGHRRGTPLVATLPEPIEFSLARASSSARFRRGARSARGVGKPARVIGRIENAALGTLNLNVSGASGGCHTRSGLVGATPRRRRVRREGVCRQPGSCRERPGADRSLLPCHCVQPPANNIRAADQRSYRTRGPW